METVLDLPSLRQNRLFAGIAKRDAEQALQVLVRLARQFVGFGLDFFELGEGLVLDLVGGTHHKDLLFQGQMAAFRGHGPLLGGPDGLVDRVLELAAEGEWQRGEERGAGFDGRLALLSDEAQQVIQEVGGVVDFKVFAEEQETEKLDLVKDRQLVEFGDDGFELVLQNELLHLVDLVEPTSKDRLYNGCMQGGRVVQKHGGIKRAGRGKGEQQGIG